MLTSNRLRDLATLVENVDAGSTAVTNVQTPGDDLVEDRTLTARLHVRVEWEALLGVDGEVSVSVPDGTAVSASDGGVEIPLDVTIGTDDRTAAAEPSSASEATQVTDGGVTVSEAPCGTAPSPASADSTGSAATPDRSDDEAGNEESDTAGTDEESADESERNDDAAETDSPPPYRDPERLREVYDAHGTFSEMTAALDADVTPQTVRRHMIKQGIHRPESRGGATTDDANEEAADESADEDGDDGTPHESTDEDAREGATPSEETDDEQRTPETESAVTDLELPESVELPSHLTLDDVRDAVAESQTLYEIQRTLRVDRTRARRLLRALDLLEFVGGRVSKADDGRDCAAEIGDRIRRACT
jgi:hypothetical protein